MKKPTLTKNEIWVLLVLEHSRNGASLEEICHKDNRKINLIVTEALKIIDKLSSEKLILKEFFNIQQIYKITPLGKEVLNKNLKLLPQSEFLDFLSFVPDEIFLGYRIYQIERFIFFAMFGWIFFELSLYLIKGSYTLTSLIIFLISIIFISISIGFVSNIITLVLYQYGNKLYYTIKNKKNVSEYLLKILNFIKVIPLKVVAIAIALILLISFFVGINILFYSQYPDTWKQFLYTEGILGTGAIILLLFKKI